MSCTGIVYRVGAGLKREEEIKLVPFELEIAIMQGERTGGIAPSLRPGAIITSKGRRYKGDMSIDVHRKDAFMCERI